MAFEPNPAHSNHLKSLAANYSTCGIRSTTIFGNQRHLLRLRVLAFTETGVSDKDAIGNFAPDLTFMEMDIVHGMTAR